jgi:hypothetical protein
MFGQQLQSREQQSPQLPPASPALEQRSHPLQLLNRSNPEQPQSAALQPQSVQLQQPSHQSRPFLIVSSDGTFSIPPGKPGG